MSSENSATSSQSVQCSDRVRNKSVTRQGKDEPVECAEEGVCGVLAHGAVREGLSQTFSLKPMGRRSPPGLEAGGGYCMWGQGALGAEGKEGGLT